MAYIDSTYVDAMLTGEIRQSLFQDQWGGSFDSDAFNQIVAAAEAEVKAALREVGYTPPSDITDADSDDQETIKLAVFGRVLAYGAGRRTWELPEFYRNAVNLIDRIRNGKVPFESLTFTARDGIGGVKFSETDEDVSGNRAPVFGRSMGR